jgi:hypothetical protein
MKLEESVIQSSIQTTTGQYIRKERLLFCVFFLCGCWNVCVCVCVCVWAIIIVVASVK